MLVAMSWWLPPTGVGSISVPAAPPCADDPPAADPPSPPPPPVDAHERPSDEVLAPLPAEVSAYDPGPQPRKAPPTATNEIHSLYGLMFSLISDSAPKTSEFRREVYKYF